MKKTSIILLALALVVSLTVVAGPPVVAAGTAGPLYPATITTIAEAPYDDVEWDDVDNIKAADGEEAAVTLASGEYSYVLRATNFGFDIPAGATIEGIKVDIHRVDYGSADCSRDAVVQLTKDGTDRVGTNKAATFSNWGTSWLIVEYGGDDDLWGEEWTVDDVNDSGFGLHLAIKNHHLTATRTGRVDFIRITVYYTPPHTISGTITVNAGLENVEVVATGGHEQTVYTDEHGYYELTGVVHGATGITITPTLAGYEFTPEYTHIAGPVTDDMDEQDFTATPLTYSISGTILDDEDDPVADVSVEATGGHDQTVTTAADGTYTLTDVPHAADVTITPTLAGYAFTPPQITEDNVTADLTDQDFTATALTYTISGTIMENGTPLEGVLVEGAGNGWTDADTTAADGTYTLTDVPHAADVTITPTLAGYTFTPPQITEDNVIDDLTGQDFAATALTYTISGTIMENGTSLEGVLVEGAGNGWTDANTTAADGTYTLTDVPHAADVTITPTLAGYAFTPPQITEDNVTADLTGQDFAATAVTYTVTFDEQNDLEDVDIQVYSDEDRTVEVTDPVTTDADGEATKELEDGDYWFTATKDGYSLYEGDFTVDGADKTVPFTMEVIPPAYTLTVDKDGEGTVEVDGAEVGLPYEEDYPETTPVELQAIAAAGWEFDRWEVDGDVVTDVDGEITVDMDDHKSATAYFEETPTYTISGTIKKDGNPLEGVLVTGTTVNPWTDTDTTDADGNYELTGAPAGRTIRITPTKAGYTFDPAYREIEDLDGDIVEDFDAEIRVLPPVGGTGHLVNRPALLAPWLALAAAIAGAAVFARRRLTQS